MGFGGWKGRLEGCQGSWSCFPFFSGLYGFSLETVSSAVGHLKQASVISFNLSSFWEDCQGAKHVLNHTDDGTQHYSQGIVTACIGEIHFIVRKQWFSARANCTPQGT